MDTQKPNAASFGSSLVKNLGSALTSGLSGGVSGVISSAIQAPLQYAFDSLSAKREHGYDIEKMKKQFQLNREQYDYERSQESPAIERMRLEQAGLSPALMYGGGVQGGMNSGITGTSISSSPSPRSSMRQVSPAEVAQFKVSQSQAENLSADTTQKRVVSEGISIENRYKEQKIITYLTKERAHIADILKSTELKGAEKEFYIKRLSAIDQEIKESNQRIAESGQRIEESKQSVKESESKEKLNLKTAEKVGKETEIMEEQRTAMLEGLVANTYLRGAQEEYYIELAEKVGKDIELISKDLEYYDINLTARLAQMTSSELRGWAGVLNDYLDRRDRKESFKMSNDEKKRQNRILLLRLVLPYLLK